MMIWQAICIAIVALAPFALPHAGKPTFAPYRDATVLLFAVFLRTLLLVDRLPTI